MVDMIVAVMVACVFGTAPATESQMLYTSKLSVTVMEQKDRLQRKAASPRV